ncbi:hypothetical protein [Yoonia sp. SS1-5]|uniref:50S ribosomal protein L35 n=1 Tax=Yoonia rhodophyticola TaxID=3137370 RepID=A0AAN0MCB9_9RHOB
MDYDLIFVIGVLLAVFSIPALVNAFSDGLLPRLALGMIAVGAGLIYLAIQSAPGAYSVEAVPDIFVSVVAKYLN